MINSYDTKKSYKNKIFQIIQETWNNNEYITVKKYKPYPIIRYNHSRYQEVDHTDGIGTKGELHYIFNTWEYAVQDALAMNLNDLLTVGAIPFKLQNHLMVERDNHEVILKIIEIIARFCNIYKIAMTGGETSVMDSVKGMDLSMTVSGYIKKTKFNNARKGDVLLGVPSSGVHSNGFTILRMYFTKEELKEFIEPTKIYQIDVSDLSAAVHVTGGGFYRLKDYIESDQCIRIYKQPTNFIFDKIYQKTSLTDDEMYKTFNCGFGMILFCQPEIAKNFPYKVIGEVVGGSGNVMIESSFSNTIFEW